jgi:membrane protease YdiL (CAAX protease family)
MKTFLAALFLSSTLYAALDTPESEWDAPSLEMVVSEELVALDPNSFGSQPMTPQDIQIPASILEPRAQKNSFLAVSLSSILPGLGHVYLDNMQTAGGLIGTATLSVLGSRLNGSSHSQDFIRSTSSLAFRTTWLYGLYAAYRDVRNFNGQGNYSYKMPTDSLLDLTAAPFNLQVLKKPEVWGGLVGSMAIAAGVGYLATRTISRSTPSLSLKKNFSPLTAFPIGIGEEAFFRGFLQSQFSEWLTPWGGVILSSIAFGAAHIPNAWSFEPEFRNGYYSVVVPWITLFGVYDGWLTLKNHSLKESVAIHAWYDFILFAIGTLAGQAAITGRAEFALAAPF